MKYDEKSLDALPWEVPDYHKRQATHLRSLAAAATTLKVKSRLLDEARQHEDIARSGAEQNPVLRRGPVEKCWP